MDTNEHELGRTLAKFPGSRSWADGCFLGWQAWLRLEKLRSGDGVRLRFSEIFFETQNYAKLVEFARQTQSDCKVTASGPKLGRCWILDS